MKMLTGILVLMLASFASHAQWSIHFGQVAFGQVAFGHGRYEREHNNAVFWQTVEDRRCRQAERIERGLKHGQLTRREIRKLQREQKHVAKQVRHLKRYNHLSRRDRREVMEHLDYVSEKIRSLKHNRHVSRRDKYRHNKKRQYAYSNGNDRQYYRNDRYVSAPGYY